MSRAIPPTVQRGNEQTSAPDALIWFVTITHPNLADPIRVVSDIFDYVLGGNDFVGILFDIGALSDNDQAPYTELRFQNVDRRIGNALRRATGRAQIEAAAYSTADFDLSVEPRTEIGAAAKVYGFSRFDLVDIEVNVSEITGRIMRRDYASEPYPGLRATADLAPGLFV